MAALWIEHAASGGGGRRPHDVILGLLEDANWLKFVFAIQNIERSRTIFI